MQVVKFFVTLALCFAAVAAKGHVLAILWRWFLVPLGAPGITVVQALGVALVINLFTMDLAGARSAEWESKPEWAKALAGIAASYLALGIGWVYLQLM